MEKFTKRMTTVMKNNEVTAHSKMETADSTSKPTTMEKLDIKSMTDYLPLYLDAILSGAPGSLPFPPVFPASTRPWAAGFIPACI